MAIVTALQAILRLLIQFGITAFVGYTLIQHGPELSQTVATSTQQVVQAAGNVAEGAGNLARDAGNMGGGVLLLGGAILLLAMMGRR